MLIPSHGAPEIPTRTSAVILSAAATFGLLADYLLRAPEWGINVPLAVAFAAAAGLAMPVARERQPSPWSWLAACFFASMWAVRDEELLLVVDLLATLALLSLPLLPAAGVALRKAAAFDVVLVPFRAAVAATAGTVDFARVVRARFIPPGARRGRLRAAAVGMILAAPLVLVFSSLFASADPVFAALATSVFSANIASSLSHAALTLIAGAVCAGYLWTLLAPRTGEWSAALPQLEIGGAQVLIPLGATVGVFVLFLGVQAPVLFGSEAFVQDRTGLTFAEYARAGFFEMVFASSLTLPLVYVAPALAGKLEGRSPETLRALLWALLALAGLVLASALWRMALYIRVYGLTEDRIYSTAVMLWIGVTIVVFSATVVRGRPQGAALGSLVGAVAALAALNLANPKALIASYNLAHREAVDLDHLITLGGDAAPILVSSIDRLLPVQRCDLATYLHERTRRDADWRGWNLARQRAATAAAKLDLAALCSGLVRPARQP
jgi:hypothetical protein